MASNLQIHVASGERLDVREFTIDQEINANFSVAVLVRTRNPDVNFDEILGKPASFTLNDGKTPRTWHGICNHAEQEHAEEGGLSTYRLTIVPKLWLLTQRRNHRMFQQMSEVDIVKKLLDEWGIEPRMKLHGEYKKRKYKVQYGETDFDFMSRMLEDTGISFYFEQAGDDTKMVLHDAPQQNEARSGSIPWKPMGGNATHGHDHISTVEFKQRVRPGKYTVQDHDYRKPATYSLASTATGGLDVEQQLERYHYNPGAFLFRGQGGDSPVADDKGASRSDEKEGARQAERRLAANRGEGKRVSLSSNAFDLAPGVVYSMTGHPRADLAKPHMVVLSTIIGTDHGEWMLHAQSVGADEAFHPPIKTQKPRTQGVESATVVGPPGQEIHCDEFGRVRVQFHWDREGEHDDNSSCWIHVNQPWGGAGYGGTSLPRIGQEVLVDFLGGDPDRPVITGRVYTALQTTPYKLPDNKTQSGWKSNSTGGTGGYNELMFEDKNGAELLRMHAEKDMATRVNHDKSYSVGNDRSASIERDDHEAISRNQTHQVGGDVASQIIGQMSGSVGLDQLLSVGGGLLSQVTGSRVHATEGASVADALTHQITSKSGTVISVGQSTIYIGPDKIVIQSPQVLLNPGADVAAASTLGSGGS